jgi:hypothetical protein
MKVKEDFFKGLFQHWKWIKHQILGGHLVRRCTPVSTILSCQLYITLHNKNDVLVANAMSGVPRNIGF